MELVTESKRPLPSCSKRKPSPPLLLSNAEESDSNNESASDLMCKEAYEDADVETQHFIEATIAYEVSVDQKMTHWNHAHTWEEVLEEVDKAAESYNDDSKGWGKLRMAFRTLGNNQKVFTAWLELLPTQSQYCSIVCGGLKLIFGAASRLKALREEAFTALMQISFSLARIGNTLKTFRASAELHKCSSALYVSILTTLENILQYYKGNSAKRMVKATFKQDEYGSKLSQSIKLMDIHSQRFKDVAAQCAYQTQTSTLDEVRSLKSRTKANNRSIMQQIEHSRSEANLQHLDTTNILKSQSEAHQRRIQYLLKEVVQLKNDQAKVCKLLKSKYMIAGPHPRNDTRSGPRISDIQLLLCPESQYVAETSTLARERSVAAEKLLAALDIEVGNLQNAIDSNLRYVWTLPLSAQDRAVTLMESQRLHTWLTSTQSSALFVNGNHDASVRQSPISYVCTKLMDSVYIWTPDMHPRYPSIVAQAFFCGHNEYLEDAETGPIDMIRSLVSQLIVNCRLCSAIDVSLIGQLINIKSLDMCELLSVFSKLIAKLPRSFLVLCIIDGITLYEDCPTQCEMAIQATKSLLDVMEVCKIEGCMFKLLMTSSGTSRALHQEFEEEEIIWMPKKINAHGGLTSTKWAASADDCLK